MACPRGWFCCLIAALTVFALAIGSAALFVYLDNRSSSATIEDMDEVVLSMSTVWCKELLMESSDGVYTFNASLVPGEPKIDSGHKQKLSEDIHLPVPANGYYLLRYYLPATSAINILQCSSKANLMSYIFRGKEVDDECLKLTEHRFPWFSQDFDMDDWGHKHMVGKDPCAGITLQRFLVKVCKGTVAKMQNMDANIAVDDYYLIYYKGSSADADVHMKLSLTRPTYDLSHRLDSCINVTSCTLPFRWGSGDSVIVQTGLGSSNSTGQHTIKWKCIPNYITYAVIFACLPIIFIITVVAVTLLCRARRRKRISERQPLLAEDESRVEEESIQDPSRMYGATSYDVPQTSCGNLPTAPPKPFIDDSLAEPFYSREPPPPYEETPSSQRPQRVAEKC